MKEKDYLYLILYIYIYLDIKPICYEHKYYKYAKLIKVHC